MKNTFFGFVLLFLLTAVFNNCATRKAPGGGPVDRIPPEIIAVFPAYDSTGISLDLDEISFTFSERMQEGSLSNNLFISPPIDHEVEWQGSKRVNLVLKESLQSERTYVITIGAGVSDERNNKMKASVQFAFSTGDAIDRGQISGYIDGIERNETFHLFAFSLDDSIPEDFTAVKPIYVSQSGAEGKFNLNYLSSGKYRIFAVQDQNNNQQIDAAYERIGIPWRDVILDSTTMQFEGIAFRITKIDTTAPYLTGVRPMNRSYINLRFSEPLAGFTETNVQVSDSISGQPLPVLGVSKNPESANIYDVFTNAMDSATIYQVLITGLQDSSGNSNPGPITMSFESSAENDTTTFRFSEFLPADSAKSLHPDSRIRVGFSGPADYFALQNSFALQTIHGDTVPGVWDHLTHFEGEFVPESFLKPDSSYNAVFDLSKVYDLWGETLADSLLSHYFTIVSSRELGGLSGLLTGENELEKPVFIYLNNIQRNKRNFSKRLTESASYRFENIPEGQYILEGFIDLDENGHYSYGKLFPFHYSEPFRVGRDTVSVRKRWEKEDINFNLPDYQRD